jgi:hypothetical protein
MYRVDRLAPVDRYFSNIAVDRSDNTISCPSGLCDSKHMDVCSLARAPPARDTVNFRGGSGLPRTLPVVADFQD